MAMEILVTGATGNVSTRVLRALATKGGVTVRAGVLPGEPPTEATRLPGVSTTALDFDDPGTWSAALRGVRRVFLLTPFRNDLVPHAQGFLDEAKRAGVELVVKLSASMSDETTDTGRWHRAIEAHATRIGLPQAILRANFYMQNFIHYYPPQADGGIYLPWGTGRAAFIDARDLAEIAALVLSGDGHAGALYELDGPEGVSGERVARAIAAATGRAIRYVDVSESTAREAMAGMKLPPWMVEAMMQLHATVKRSAVAETHADAARLLGRELRSVEQFARDHAAAWASA